LCEICSSSVNKKFRYYIKADFLRLKKVFDYKYKIIKNKQNFHRECPFSVNQNTHNLNKFLKSHVFIQNTRLLFEKDFRQSVAFIQIIQPQNIIVKSTYTTYSCAYNPSFFHI
jgi:hypothetical protein